MTKVTREIYGIRQLTNKCAECADVLTERMARVGSAVYCDARDRWYCDRCWDAHISEVSTGSYWT